MLALRRYVNLIVIVGVVLALLALSATLTSLRLAGGTGDGGSLLDLLLNAYRPPPPQFVISDSLWALMRVLVWGSVAVAVLVLARGPEARRDFSTLAVRVTMMLILGFIQFLVVRAYVLSFDDRVVLEDEATYSAEPVTLTDLAEPAEFIAENVEPPAVLTALLTIAFVGGVALLAGLAWRRRPARPARPEPYAELTRRARAALDELRGGTIALDDIILRCYREMAQIVARQRGVQRRTTTTPREFAQELTHIGLPPGPIDRLTQLFEKVRYGDFVPTERDRLAAVDSLQAIIDALDAMRSSHSQASAGDVARPAAGGRGRGGR